MESVWFVCVSSRSCNFLLRSKNRWPRSDQPVIVLLTGDLGEVAYLFPALSPPLQPPKPSNLRLPHVSSTRPCVVFMSQCFYTHPLAEMQRLSALCGCDPEDYSTSWGFCSWQGDGTEMCQNTQNYANVRCDHCSILNTQLAEFICRLDSFNGH